MASEENEPSSGAKAPLGVTGWLALLACAAVPPVFATAFTRFEDVKMGLAGVLFGAVFLAFGIAVMRGKTITLTAGRIVVAALVFAVYAAVSVLWSPVVGWGAVHTTTWLAGVAAFLAVLAPEGRPLGFREFSAAVGIGAAVSGLFGILDFAGLEFFTPVWNPLGPTAAFDAAEFVQPYYAIALPILVAGVWRNRGVFRGLCAAGLGLGAFHLGLCGTWLPLTALAIVASVVTLLVLALQRFQRFPLLLPAMALFVVAMVVSAIPVVAIDSDEQDPYATALPRVTPNKQDFPGAELIETNFASGRWESVTSTNGLDYALGIGFSLFREQPVFGQGPYGWWQAQTRYPDAGHPWVEGRFDHYPALRTPHNSFMRLLVEYGGAGLLLFLLWMTAIAGITFTALSTREEPESWLLEHWGLTVAVLTGVVFAFFSPALELAGSAVIWFMAVALLARESALLNELKGLSAPLTINADGRRYDVVAALGVLPAILGVGMVAVSALGVGSNYYRGLDDHLMLRGHYHKVGPNYEEAEDLLPGRGELHYNIALAKKRSESLEAGADYARKALELRPDDARMLNLVAYLEVQEKELDEAIRLARKAHARFPNFVEAYRAEALGQDLSNSPEKAVEVIDAILERDPPAAAKARLNREAGQYYLGPLKQPGKAAEYLEKAAILTEDSIVRGEIKKDLDRARAMAEAERLMREGKAVPKELQQRMQPPSEHLPFGDGHDHGGHDHGPGGMPEGPAGLPVPPPMVNPDKANDVDSAAEDHDGHDHEGHDH